MSGNALRRQLLDVLIIWRFRLIKGVSRASTTPPACRPPDRSVLVLIPGERVCRTGFLHIACAGVKRRSALPLDAITGQPV